MDTLYLLPDTWDLAIDASGNIAMATAPYAVAQDVASACRLWKGEALFDTTRGIPYKSAVLGYLPPQAQLTDWYKVESETVPEVASALPILQFNNRNLTGQIQITLTDGETVNVAIN